MIRENDLKNTAITSGDITPREPVKDAEWNREERPHVKPRKDGDIDDVENVKPTTNGETR